MRISFFSIWRHIAAAGLIIILAAGCGGEDRAVYKWKSTSEWASMLDSPDPETRVNSLKALARIGQEKLDISIVVPSLLKAVRDESSVVRRQAFNSVLEVGPVALPGLIAVIEHESFPAYFTLADELLKNIGEKGAQSARLLAEALLMSEGVETEINQDQKEERLGVIREILSKGNRNEFLDAYTALKSGLDTENRKLRMRLLMLVGEVWGEDLGQLEKALEKNIDDKEREISRYSISTLETIDNERKSTIAVLERCCKSEDPGIRREAVASLGNLGPEALPLLIGYLNDEKLDVSFSALAAVDEMKIDAAPLLVSSFKDLKDEFVKFKAALIIVEVEPESSQGAVTFLRELLRRGWVENADYYWRKILKSDAGRDVIAADIMSQIEESLENAN